MLIQLTVVSYVVDNEFIFEILFSVLNFEEKPVIVFGVVKV